MVMYTLFTKMSRYKKYHANTDKYLNALLRFISSALRVSDMWRVTGLVNNKEYVQNR